MSSLQHQNKMSSYRELLVWQKAMDLVDNVYIALRRFSREELFALSQQMRNAAVSIPSNIAEGWGRWSLAEYRLFVRNARCSALELQTQIVIAKRQKFVTGEVAEKLDAQAEEVGKMLNGLLRTLTPKP